jgi:hypothetical protein
MARLPLAFLLVAAWFGAGGAAAQPQGRCLACINAAACEGRHDSCVAECRARLFSIDPKRAACIADCGSKAAECVQAANSACRAGSSCP